MEGRKRRARPRETEKKKERMTKAAVITYDPACAFAVFAQKIVNLQPWPARPVTAELGNRVSDLSY